MYRPYQSHFPHMAVSELIQCVCGPNFNGQHQFTLVVSLAVTPDLQKCPRQLWVQDKQVFLQRFLTLLYFPETSKNVWTSNQYILQHMYSTIHLDRTFFLQVAKAFHIRNLANVPILTSLLKCSRSQTHWSRSVNSGSLPAIMRVTPCRLRVE